MSGQQDKLRNKLVQIMQDMERQGLNHGTAGNACVRLSKTELLITPSGVPAEQLTAQMMVLMSLNGDYEGDYKPSSEWRMHTGILQGREDVAAVVHCHSRFATTLACAHKTIPPMHYMTAITGGAEVRLAPYATFGSQALADAIVHTLDGRLGCLMANHGQIALGNSLGAALAIASEVEIQASFYYGTLAIGGPAVLSEAQMSEVMDQFATYGQK